MDFQTIRRDYSGQALDELSVPGDPFDLFHAWFQQAVHSGIREANAMTLATASADGNPSARIVLLKGVEHGGFVFYTNYLSRKGSELEVNPRAELVFYWSELERQLRVHGSVSKVSEQDSDSYFAARPLEARLGAHASRQSSVLENRRVLESRLADVAKRFQGSEVPRPAGWGGYRVTPESVEFWQGRPSRLHDRILYERLNGDSWTISRLSP